MLRDRHRIQSLNGIPPQGPYPFKVQARNVPMRRWARGNAAYLIRSDPDAGPNRELRGSLILTVFGIDYVFPHGSTCLGHKKRAIERDAFNKARVVMIWGESGCNNQKNGKKLSEWDESMKSCVRGRKTGRPPRRQFLDDYIRQSPHV